MPYGKGTYGSKVGRPPKKKSGMPKGKKTGRISRSAAKPRKRGM